MENEPEAAVVSQRDGIHDAGGSGGTAEALALPADKRNELLLVQFAECWADNRNFDAILWQIPAAIGAIAGLMLNALVSDIARNGVWIRPLVAAGAALITFPLVVALIKNRIFQIDRNNWRISLYNALAGDPALSVDPRSVAPEVAGTKGLVLFSSPHLRARFDRGPWYWRTTANTLKSARAYNVLLFVSLLVLATELCLALGLTLGALVWDWQ